jgi:hypothetical protein
VSTVNFSILINGSPSKQFKPQRGLRQGDPLSPYLFIICADVLSGLIAQGQQNHLIHGVKIAPRDPEVTHLLFVDDSLFFCRANKKETSTLKNIIQTYEEASGQMVNMSKSELISAKKFPMTSRLRFPRSFLCKGWTTSLNTLACPLPLGDLSSKCSTTSLTEFGKN